MLELRPQPMSCGRRGATELPAELRLDLGLVG
jgi:hypothetical protein